MNNLKLFSYEFRDRIEVLYLIKAKDRAEAAEKVKKLIASSGVAFNKYLLAEVSFDVDNTMTFII